MTDLELLAGLVGCLIAGVTIIFFELGAIKSRLNIIEKLEATPMRDPVTEPRVGDAWIMLKDKSTWLIPDNALDTEKAAWIRKKGGYVPAVVIPLELAQRMMQYGNEIKGGAGYIADDLARYMPQNEVGE